MHLLAAVFAMVLRELPFLASAQRDDVCVHTPVCVAAHGFLLCPMAPVHLAQHAIRFWALVEHALRDMPTCRCGLRANLHQQGTYFR